MAPNISDLKTHEKGASDPIVQRLAQEDPVPWYKKPNLRLLYLLLFPTCMGIEITSGFDSQMINALQLSKEWQSCKKPLFLVLCRLTELCRSSPS